jgi:hypothetical protein
MVWVIGCSELVALKCSSVAFSSPDNFSISSKSLREKTPHNLLNFLYHDYSFCRDKVNRAAGLRAVVMVFAEPLRQFYHDGTTSYRLSGLSHLDNFIMTRKLSSIYRDFAKTHANPDTDGNFPYHRAVSKNISVCDD